YTEGGIEKAFVTLVGFAKTKKLHPGQSQVVTVKFNVQDAASFDYNDANGNDFFGYELEAGEYIVKVMEDSHRVADEKSFTLETGATLALDDFSGNPTDNVFSKGDIFDTVRKNSDPENADSPLNVNASNDAAQKLLSRADLSTEAVLDLRITEAERTLSDAFVKSVVFWIEFTAGDQAKFADDQDAALISGSEHIYWYKTDDALKELMAGWKQAAAHEEGYTDVVTKLKDMSGIDMDTEEGRAAWTAFMNQLTWDEIKSIDNRGGHTTVAVPSIGKVASKDENGPNSYMGKSWCDATVLASTWNVDLARQYGILNANLGMLGNTIQEGWYGPGMDLHRTPFGGRNNEYYSQDGIQGGYIGAAQVGGAQSRGLNVYIKHMFMNDQESSRQGLFTWVSEQAIREIYAKAFQMCMQEGGSTSAMTAFNRIGAIDAIMCEPMLIRMVRDEWGWDGQYVTDFYTAVKSRHMDLLIRSGNDLPDGTASGQYAVSGTWKADAVGLGTADAPAGNVIFGEGDDAKESLLQWYYARVCAERVLYVAANTLNNRNGVDTTAQNLSFELAQGVAAEDISIALSEEALNGNPVTYSVTGGALPEGLSLNANTGAITGTPTGSGSSSVTITAAIAGWLKSTIRASFDISSAFKLVQFEGDKEVVKDQFAGKVGEAFEGFIDSDVVTAEQFNQGIRYEVADGYALPKGLALGEGLIEGTPEEAGTFDVVINLVGTNQTGSGRNARTTTSRFAIPVTIVIEEGEGGAEGGIQLRVSEGYLQFTTDGETWTNLITIEALKEFLK
ncbi:MAG: putative Ig domain-containing protein, partial [Lachnospiraceae bacterium]|nr:putative Ig domain-containing protein [Lachnospiraceae bacterium]